MERQIKEQYLHLTVASPNQENALTRLSEIVKILRRECPWDKVQTHESLRKGIIEESYEVCEAINNNDMDNLREELGDVLLQIVFHAQLEEEEERFNLADLINEECEKMIRRHPHVFLKETPNNTAKSIDKVLEKWENIKVEETGQINASSRLNKVPRALPALMRAYKIQKKAADVGFDWDDVSGAFDKIREEAGELLQCYNDNKNDSVKLQEELGDLVFSCVNVARFLGLDPEMSLNQASEKFIKRFTYVEEAALTCGKDLGSMTLEEMDALWEEAKRKERDI